jgi:hypothetical protein
MEECASLPDGVAVPGGGGQAAAGAAQPITLVMFTAREYTRPLISSI